MSLISSTIPNLFNGVSQQPFMQRLTSQGAIQLNGYSSLVEGLRKRPPSVYLSKLLASPLTNAYVHTINRSTTQRYNVIFTGTSLYVTDMVGVAKTVTYPNGTAYLTDASPNTAFAAISVADYTFIVNKNITTAMDATQVSPTRPYEALLWCRSSNYSCKYSLQVGGRLAVKTTQDAAVAASQRDIQTLNIVNDLYIMLTTGSNTGTSQPTLCTVSGSIDPNIQISNLGSSLYIHNAVSDFTMTESDGAGDTAMVVCKGTVSAFSQLPARAQAGMVVSIGSQGPNGDNNAYWVTYQADANNPYGGIWVECAKPAEVIGFDAATMPHVLVHNADDTFTFKQATWTPRAAGSTVDLANPSFVGQALNDVIYYEGRLGFLAGSNVFLGVTDDTFNLFRASALQLLDTDPVDYAATSGTVAILKAAAPFQGSLLLFSDQQQFQLIYNGILSPKTVDIVPATNFVSSLQARPVSVGANVYFAVPKGTFTGVREYYLDGAARITDANDITSHVPKYVPGTPIKLTAASNEDCLVMLASGDATSLWVYRYYWQGGQKMQSAWSQWQFAPGDTILNCEFIVNTLYLTVSRSDGVYLESINVQPGLGDSFSPWPVHLDRKTTQFRSTPVYDAGTNTTTVTMAYQPDDWTKFQLVAWHGDATYQWGRLVPYTVASANSFSVPGNLTSYFFGRQYTFQYRFSTFTAREPVPMTYTMQAVTEGRLQLRTASVSYANTGYFRVSVTPFQRGTSTYTFSADALGTPNALIGSPSIATAGIFKFPVQCQNTYATIDLINDSYLPCFFESAGWEGYFVLRSRRM